MTTPVRRSGEASGEIGVGNDLSIVPAGGCFGEGCDAVEPWPVHQIRYRNNVFLLLCTSCVLKHHLGSFCCSCFEVIDTPERAPLVHCSKCPSVTHLRCLPNPSIAPLFLCPACDSHSPTSYSYFPYSKLSADRLINLRAAKILLAAACLSSASMNRAAALARADADKKVKEAALARKRARDMLDRSFTISEMEREKNIEKARTAAAPIKDTVPATFNLDESDPKKKAPTVRYSVTSDAAAQKRAQDREREKWKRFSEPIGSMNRSLMVVGANEKVMEHLNSNVKDNVPKDEKKMMIASGSPTGISEQE